MFRIAASTALIAALSIPAAAARADVIAQTSLANLGVANGTTDNLSDDFTTVTATDSVLLVAIAGQNSDPIGTVSFGTQNLSLVADSAIDVTRQAFIYALDLGDEVGETGSISIDFSANNGNGIAAFAIQVSNADFDTIAATTASTSNGTASDVSISLVGLPGGSFIFDVFSDNNSSTNAATILTTGAVRNESGTQDPISSIAAGSFIAGASGDVTLGYDGPDNNGSAYSVLTIESAGVIPEPASLGLVVAGSLLLFSRQKKRLA